MKLSNEYVDILPAGFFDKIPKTVWAAIAISYALNLRGAEDVTEEILSEWRALYQNGIVSQRPPKEY